MPLLDEDYLILSTIHSAKGQEWKSVFVLNCVDGCIPSDLGAGTSEELEEERRLLYVAMTRARDHLDLIVPQRFYVTGQRSRGDRHVYAQRTRFIPERILSRFDTRLWPPRTAEAERAASGVRVDVGAKVRRMWGRGAREASHASWPGSSRPPTSSADRSVRMDARDRPGHDGEGSKLMRDASRSPSRNRHLREGGDPVNNVRRRKGRGR